MTPSQITEQYMFQHYPCLPAWVSFIQNTFPNQLNYDATSCSQIAQICHAAMKTIEYIQQQDEKANVVRVMRDLNQLYSSGWDGWTSFFAQTKNATGSRSLGTTANAIHGITQLSQWDAGLNPTPNFNPPKIFYSVLNEVSS